MKGAPPDIYIEGYCAPQDLTRTARYGSYDAREMASRDAHEMASRTARDMALRADREILSHGQ